MPGTSRLGDKAHVPKDSHGCRSCSHSCIGPATSGSENVNVNGRPVLRIGDTGVHSSCCGANTWEIVAGSGTVFVNGRKVARLGDTTQHCGGIGKLVDGSADVITDGGGSDRGQPKPSLRVKVLDPQNRPAIGATVKVVQGPMVLKLTIVPPPLGEAVLSDLPPGGGYQIAVSVTAGRDELIERVAEEPTGIRVVAEAAPVQMATSEGVTVVRWVRAGT